MSGMAAERYRTRSGWAVEVVQLAGTPNHRDGAWIRITHHGFYIADVRDPADIQRWLALSELECDALSQPRIGQPRCRIEHQRRPRRRTALPLRRHRGKACPS
jgi:hypothetical protein